MESWLPAERARIEAAIVRPRPLQRGDFVFELNATVEFLPVLRAGSAKSCVSGGDGEEHIVRFSHPGDLLGIEDMGATRHLGSIQVLETSSICRIPRQCSMP